MKRAHDRLQMLEGIPELTLTFEPPDCDHTFYLFTLLVPQKWGREKRDQLCQMLQEEYNVGTMVENPPVWEAQPYIHRRTCDQITPSFGGNGETIILYLVAPINE